MEKCQVVAADRQVVTRNGQGAAPNGQVRARFFTPFRWPIRGGCARSGRVYGKIASTDVFLHLRQIQRPHLMTASHVTQKRSFSNRIGVFSKGGEESEVLGVRCQVSESREQVYGIQFSVGWNWDRRCARVPVPIDRLRGNHYAPAQNTFSLVFSFPAMAIPPCAIWCAGRCQPGEYPVFRGTVQSGKEFGP